jgi:membrane-bound serine protease (ClpP class)
LSEFTGLLDLLGALMKLLGIKETAMLPAIALVILFLIVAVPVGLLASARRVTTGEEGMIGLVGDAATDLRPRGRVFVHSEYWNAVSDEEIPAGTSVVVVSVNHLLLKVKRNPAA